MDFLIRLLAVLSGGLFVGGVTAVAVPPPSQATPVVQTSPVQDPPQRASYRVWRDDKSAPVVEDANCPKYLGLAITIGWKVKDLRELDRIMYRESRCQPAAFNPKDPNGGSAGLLQINYFWCKPSRYYPQGYLQSMGVLNTCEQLFEPGVNLLSALVVYQYALDNNGNGWHPWRT